MDFQRKGQYFLIFTVIFLIIVFPVFFLSGAKIETSISDEVHSHLENVPKALNGIVLKNESIDLDLRNYLELERNYFRERLTNFNSFIVLAVPDNELQIYIANYYPDQTLILNINGDEKVIELRAFEIRKVSFDRANSYDLIVELGNETYQFSSFDKAFYFSKWKIERNDERFEIVRGG